MATYTISRVSDAKVLAVFEPALNRYGESGLTLQLAGVRHAISLRDARMDALRDALSESTFSISSANLNIGGFRVDYIRGTRRANEVPGAALFDQIEISHNDGPSKLDDRAAFDLANNIIGQFQLIRPEAVTADSITDQGRVTALYTSILERLTEAATKQTEQINSFLREKQNEIDGARKQLQDDFDKRKAAADEDIAARQASLDERSTKLDQLQKALDDRDNTHVRREIRRDLNNRINDRMSKLTVSARSLLREAPVHVVFIGIIGLAASIFATQSSLTYAIVTGDSERPAVPLTAAITNPVFISLLFKQTFASITAIAAAVYYVRWLIRQHSRYGQLENDLRRYQIDFERASWVVETALEWRRDQHAPFPDPLLAAVSRQLFVPETQSADVDHAPVDMLASALLGSASKVNLHAGPANIEWDGKKLNKAEMPKA